MKYTVRELIKDRMRAKHISQWEVSRGLCSESSMCKYLKGERGMDRLMFNIVLQRVGLSPDDFTLIVGDSEYQYFEWRTCVIEAMRGSDWAKVGELLHRKERKCCGGRKHLEKLFEVGVKAALAEEYYKNTEEALELYQEAIRVTVPYFTLESVQEAHLWSGEEMCVILSFLELKSRQERITDYLSRFFDWVERSDMDMREKAKFLPLMAKVYGGLLLGEQDYERCAEICYKTLEIMRFYNTSMMMEQVLECYIQAMAALGREKETAAERNWLECWCRTQEFAGVRRCDVVMAYATTFGQEIMLFSEVIRSERLRAGICLDDLSYEVGYDAASLNRIECGTHTPRKGTFRKIAKALNIQGEYCYGEISGDSEEVYELKLQCALNNMHDKTYKNKDLLNWLEWLLDMSIPENRQYIESSRNSMELDHGLIDGEEYIRREKQVLAYTTDMDISREICRPLRAWEPVVIVQIARGYQIIGNGEEAIRILKELLAYYERSKVRMEFHLLNIVMIYNALSYTYYCEGKWEEVVETGKKGIEFLVKCDKGYSVAGLLNNYACGRCKTDNPAVGKEYFKLTAGLAAIYHHESLRSKAERNYDKVLEMEVKIK